MSSEGFLSVRDDGFIKGYDEKSPAGMSRALVLTFRSRKYSL